MEIVHKNCAGLDVHKKTVVACVHAKGKKGEVRTFATTTRSLLEMMDWFADCKVEIVAMESTGVFWKPVWNVLEGSECQLMLVNAQHIKQVPGRKTDVKDAEWIAELLRHGLLKPSHVPSRDRRELQELVRFRRSQIEERARAINRIHKVLEGANIKVTSVVTDITGKTGTAILRALVKGEQTAAQMADLAVGKLVKKRELLEESLEGSMNQHQRFMLGVLTDGLFKMNEQIDSMDLEVEKRMRPFEQQLKLLDGIPGFALRGAQDLLAEIGIDMGVFPSHRHLASWLQLCPGNSYSAGKKLRSKSRGTPYGKSLVVQLAWPAVRTRGSYFRSLFERLKARRGAKRAIVAVAHAMIVTVYHVLSKNTPFQDLGSDHHDKLNKEKVIKRLSARLGRLGFDVALTPTAA